MENLSSLGANYRREIACVEIVEASPAVVVTPQRCEATIVVADIFADILLRNPYVGIWGSVAESHVPVKTCGSVAAGITRKENRIGIVRFVRRVLTHQVQIIHGRRGCICALIIGLFLSTIERLKWCQRKIACHERR